MLKKFSKFKFISAQLWKFTKDNRLVNKNGGWQYEDYKWNIPKEGDEDYISDKATGKATI